MLHAIPTMASDCTHCSSTIFRSRLFFSASKSASSRVTAWAAGLTASATRVATTVACRGRRKRRKTPAMSSVMLYSVGTMTSVRAVDTTSPKHTATAIGPQNWALSPPTIRSMPRKSTLTPVAMGIRPSTVVMAVRMTGRKRTSPAWTRDSRASTPLLLRSSM